MPAAFKTALGNNGNSTSGTTLAITTTAAIAVGDLVVVRWAADNLSATTPTATCADGGNTYTVQQQGAVNATAAAGVAGGILTTKATVARPSGSTITLTLSGAVAAKAVYAESFTSADNVVRSTAVIATGASTAAASPASGTVAAGDLVLGWVAWETRGALTGDADTGGGTWSTIVTKPSATSGSDATCVSVGGQYKIPNTATAQTFNIGGVSAEWVTGVVVLQAAKSGSATATNTFNPVAVGKKAPKGGASTTAAWACSAVGPSTPNPKLATLKDSFDVAPISTTKWPENNGVVWDAGRAKIPLSPSYYSLKTAQTAPGRAYDFKDSSIFAKITLPPMTAGREAYFEVWLQGSTLGDRCYFRIYNPGTPTIETQRVDANNYQWSGAATYDPVAHAWLQIRETAGTVYFEGSPDGTTWSTIGSGPTPAWDIGKSTAQFNCTQGGADAAADMFLDNVNVAPSTGVSAYHTAVLASSPVAFWPLDESSGPAIDKVAGHNGTRQGAVLTATVFGRTVLSPNGGYVEVADFAGSSPHAGANGKMTVEAILQRQSDGSWFAKAAGGGYEFNARVNGTTIQWFFWDGPSANNVGGVQSTNPELVVGTDYHIAVTYDRAAQTGTIYKNGVATPTSTDWTGLNTADGTAPINIGRRSDGADGGTSPVGCVAFYDRVLTAAEVLSHYNALFAAPTPAGWSDTTFVNINSGGDYWTVGQYGTDTWDPVVPSGIQEHYGFGTMVSIRQAANVSGADQYVKLTVPDTHSQWVLVFRASSTPGAEWNLNGYTIRYQGPQYVIFFDATGSQVGFNEPVVPTGPGTVEGRCVGSVVTIYVNGTQISQFDYAATPQTGNYVGFGASNQTVITTAEGSGGVAPSAKTGSATVTWTEAVTAAGKKTPKSTVTVSYTEVLATIGKRTPKAVAATTSNTFNPVAVGIAVPPSFAPTDIAGLNLWLDASQITGTPGTPLEVWPDSSGNNNNAQQHGPPANMIPSYVTSDGKPAVQFTPASGDQFYQLVPFTGATELEVFIVLKSANYPPPSYPLTGIWWTGTSIDRSHHSWIDGTIYDSFGTDVRKTAGTPPSSLSEWHTYNVVSAAGEWTARLNGTTFFTTATNTVSIASLPLLGFSGDAYYLDAVVSEFVLYTRRLSTAERTQVEDYLQDKWIAAGPNKGAATVSNTFNPTAVGKRTPKGTAATGNFTEAVTSAGKRTPKGAVTTTYAEAVAAVGYKMPKGSAPSGNFIETLTVVSKRTPKSTITTTHTWVPAAVGAMPVVNMKQGAATTTYAYNPVAVGKRTPKATATINDTFNPVVAGKKIQKGVATTQWVEAVTAAGKYTPKGAAVTTALQIPAATGKRVPKGAASTGFFIYNIDAQGVTPVVGVKQGSGFINDLFNPSAAGKRIPKGGNAIANTWVCAAVGKKTQKGVAAAGNYTEAVTATGKKVPKATTLVSNTFNPAAVGKRFPKGVATPATHTWTLTAQGIRPVVGVDKGNGLIDNTWTPAAVGRRTPKGSSTLGNVFVLAATGKKIQSATVVTTFSYDSGAVGKKLQNSIVVITPEWTLTADGQRVPKGRGDTDYWFSQVALGLEGLTSQFTMLWNGQEAIEMQYGDKPVLNWFMTPA